MPFIVAKISSCSLQDIHNSKICPPFTYIAGGPKGREDLYTSK